jgi:hypothetical protein
MVLKNHTTCKVAKMTGQVLVSLCDRDYKLRVRQDILYNRELDGIYCEADCNV